MKKVLLESAKVVGTATEKAWSQTHLFFPDEPQKQTQRGDFLAVLSLSGLKEGIEAVAAGREIISRLHEEYFGNLEDKPLTRLKRAIEKIQEEADSEAEIEIGAAAVVDRVLYLAITGQGRAFLQRGNQLGLLLEGKDEVMTASGYLQPGDLFLLGTAGFFKIINLDSENLKSALATNSPQEAVEVLAPLVHGQSSSGTAAAVVARVNEFQVPVSTISQEPVKKEPGETIPSSTGPSDPSPDPSLKESLPKKTLKTRLSQPINRFFSSLQGRLGKKTIYLRLPQVTQQGWEEFRRRKKPERSPKTIFTVILVLLLLLGISVGLGARQRERQGVEKKTAGLLAQAQAKKQEAEALLELNPARAREILLEAQGLSERIEAEGLASSEFEVFKKELAQALSRVLKEHQVKAEVFYDLELIKQGARGDDWATSGDKIIVLDKQKSTVYEIDLEKKATIIAGGENLTGARQVAAFLPKVYILTDTGVLAVDRLTKKEELVIEKDEEWGEIIDFWAFGGNLYLLDKEGEIWQYPAIETGFGARRRWLKGETEYDFADTAGLAIDGSVWVLKKNGLVWKFTRGGKDAFGAAGLDQPFSNVSQIYTDDDQQNLYLLDKGNSRVVVLAKSGEYQASYLIGAAAQAEGLMAFEEAEKILLLQGGKIMEVEMKASQQ